MVVFAAASLHAQRWQQRVNYSIDVTLNDSTHSLDGSVRMLYINHSPDTLPAIWIRCCANAFKSDYTAFSEALIREGRTDFYFSDKDRKGYINRLEFRADGQLARVEDHPRYIDVIRVILPHPLAPGDSVLLSTIYHVQLPDNFTGNGYHEGVYEVTQWYPKPAVYDGSGWHPDPYLSQAVSYNEFGDVDVRIHVPAGFVVAAPVQADASMRYHTSGVPDFVWFASRRFHHVHDTLRLPSGRVVGLYSFYSQPNSPVGRYGTGLLKDALRFYSNLLGEYPFDQATVVETVETREVSEASRRPDAAAATYAGIVTADSRDTLYSDIKRSIARELAEEWSAVLTGANGYRYPWMTEGMATYFYNRYRAGDDHLSPKRIPDMPDTFNRRAVNLRAVLKTDQPISTSAEDFTSDNYRNIAGYKTSIWMADLRHAIGATAFDSCIRDYFRREAFHHSGPPDFKAAFSAKSAPVDLDSAFRLLDTTGPVPPSPYHRRLQPNIQPIPHPTRSNSLNIAPAVGFNNYEHWMIGVLIHNYNDIPDKLQLVATPLYSPVSHQWNGLLHLNRAWYPRKAFREVEAGINGSRFSTLSGTDSSNHAIFGGSYKVVPYIRLFLPRAPLSTETIELEGKAYLIGEKTFDNYLLKSTDSLYYPVSGKYRFRYLNQLTLSIRDERVLYPYAVNVQVQQSASFYRFNVDLHYFFNYAATGGLAVRLFGAKFG
ncbi:MAG TPA: M1 family metallopeptidase, partial [Puia sp.]|nr:M1 family metallopeptidase [Puia sp.]